MHLLSFECFTLIICLIAHVEIRADVSPALLYDTGVKDYLDNNYDGCVEKLERALELYNKYSGKLRRCNLQCHAEVDYDEPLYKIDVEDLLHYERTIKNTLCLLKCKQKNNILGVWDQIDDHVIDIFEKRKPYEYLHVCYAHNAQFQQAANAAFTYLVVNPNDAGVLASLQHYASQANLAGSDVINREAKDYVYLYVHGTRAYEEKHWDEVVQNMEASLESLLQEEEECRAQCEGPFPQAANDFISSIANHFTHVLFCKRKCNDKLSTLNGEKRDDLLPSHYHYLQYAYFKSGKLKDACQAVASYLLFYPGDKTMMHNIEYYSTLPKVEKGYFQPRSDALKYIHRHTYESKIIDYINNVFAVEAGKIFRSVKDAKEEQIQELRPKAKVKRFALSKIATSEECHSLMHIADYFAIPGDGYQVGGGSPHTQYENYDGLSLKRAADLWRLQQLDVGYLNLLLNVTANVKRALEFEFDISKRLHYAYTHLVCRSAKSGASALNRTDFSHPVHADNCNLQLNGTCPKTWPAFTWRDYTAILYLNSDFQGGELFFANDYFGRNVEHMIKPTCGRLVGFTSGGENLHGVRAIKKGKRCALAIWFTFDQRYAENDRKFLFNMLISNK